MSSEPSRRCVVCGSSFEGRVDAQYCSAACRQAAYRDRGASNAIVRIGGIAAPVILFNTAAGPFGTESNATIELGTLRGEPEPDCLGFIRVDLRVGDSLIWSGDLARIERTSSSVALHAVGLGHRLECQRWGPGTWGHLSTVQLAQGAARRAGLDWIAPSQPLDARPLGPMLEDAGACTASHLLLCAARELGADLHLTQDGALYLGAAMSAEPNVLAVRNVRISKYGSSAPLAVIVRSHRMVIIGGGARDQVITTGTVSDVPPGTPVYIAHVHGRQQFHIDELAESLSRDLSGGMVHVEGTTDDPIAPGALVRVAETGDLALTVQSVRHSFSIESGLQTAVHAVFVPPAPIVPAAHQMPATRVVGPARAA